jgi:dienelactone hydrolase
MPLARGLTTVLTALVLLVTAASGDDVLLKNKHIYRGTVEKDNTVRQISDKLKRIVIRDSKIEKITPSDPYRNLERFAVDQPLEVHGGVMPAFAYGVVASPWDEKGRREFSYIGPGGQRIQMRQAINDLGPVFVGIRGIDGFWKGSISTKQVPKASILAILGRVRRDLLNERQRVARFLLQAEWYDEARTEVEAIGRDFPERREWSKELVTLIDDSQTRQQLLEIVVIRQSRKPRELLSRLRALRTEHAAPDVQIDAREQIRKEEDLVVADRRLGEALREAEKGLKPEVAKEWKRQIAEVLKGLEAAPDVGRVRLDAFAKSGSGVPPEDKLALAMSGWIVGPEAAAGTLEDASALWKARSLVRDYLRAEDEGTRAESLSNLQTLKFAVDNARPEGKIDTETLTRIIQLMPPPRSDVLPAEGKAIRHRVAGDDNSQPTEYSVLLPPEYHPLRNYPTILAIHDGPGPQQALDYWASEAARRGYIIVAPEYMDRSRPADYRYSISEHASIELSIRDARKRYAIDSDRIYVAGQVLGGQAALDFGLSHPDVVAGAASISGVPAKFVYAYRQHVDYVPLYIAMGDLVGTANRDSVFDGFAKPMIVGAEDVTYVEYFHRGIEELPEEAPAVVEWMDKRRREPILKKFEVATARSSDARFFGVVVQEIAPGRSIAPEAAEMTGKNIRPATIQYKTSSLSNLISITTTGLNRLDVWVSPKVIDFKRKFEVRINDRPFFKGLGKPDIGQMLTDLRFRGDRQQLFWFKISTSRG